MIGIYIIKNNDNGKVYVGQSKNISHRKSTHFYDLKNNRSHSKSMQADYNINPDAFSFEVLCECNENELDDLERYYIQKHKSDILQYGYNLENGGKTGYCTADSTRILRSNISRGNKNMCGIKLSDDWKRHLSEAQPHKKRILCVDTNIVYDSFADAARKTGLNRTKIVSVCTGHRKTTGGMRFKYYDETRNNKQLDQISC